MNCGGIQTKASYGTLLSGTEEVHQKRDQHQSLYITEQLGAPYSVTPFSVGMSQSAILKGGQLSMCECFQTTYDPLAAT